MTLKELIIHYQEQLIGVSDLEIIKQWFIINNREQEGLTLIPELAKSKTDKLEKILNEARLWIPSLPGTFESLRNTLGEEFTDKFNMICSQYLLGMPLSEGLKEWAQSTIPNLKTPVVIFRPALEWLKKEYGIEFKDRKI